MIRHKHYPEGLEVVGDFSVDRHLKLQKFRLREKRCYPLVYFFLPDDLTQWFSIMKAGLRRIPASPGRFFLGFLRLQKFHV